MVPFVHLSSHSVNTFLVLLRFEQWLIRDFELGLDFEEHTGQELRRQ